MASPFLYSPGVALSIAELSAARIDGDVVDVGDAYMPADAVETAELRAASIAPLLPTDCAATHLSAAWIHGALPAPPARLAVQRTRASRRRVDPSLRIEYHDAVIDPADLIDVGGIPVASSTHTVANLARSPDECSRRAARALVSRGGADQEAARRWLWTHSNLPGIGAALHLLARVRTS